LKIFPSFGRLNRARQPSAPKAAAGMCRIMAATAKLPIAIPAANAHHG